MSADPGFERDREQPCEDNQEQEVPGDLEHDQGRLPSGVPGPAARQLRARWPALVRAASLIAIAGWDAGMLEATRAVSTYKLPSAELIGSKIPVEVIWGERDRLVSLIDGERLAVAVDAGFTVLHGVGHCVPEESPEAVIAAIRGTSVARKAKDRGSRDIAGPTPC